MLKKIKKPVLFTIILISIFAALGGLVFAQQVDVNYPDIPGADTPEKNKTDVADYVKYAFNFALIASGIIALGVLVWAGFKYFTSAGSPQKMKDARDRIAAVLIGLVILFGSYIILTTINPNLVIFNLPRVRPIISELPPGVLVCREGKNLKVDGKDAVELAWSLITKFKYANPSKFEEDEIKSKLDEVFEKISLNCYYIAGAQNIRADFDNKITDVYFIPGEQKIKDKTYLALYGAVFYEEKDFNGGTRVSYAHVDPKNISSPIITDNLKHEKVNYEIKISPSSVRPFILNIETLNDIHGGDVFLYGDYNYNYDLTADPTKPFFGNVLMETISKSGWWKRVTLKWPPKSMKVDANLTVFLFKENDESEMFERGSYADLEGYDNIVEWKSCGGYQGSNKQQGSAGGGMAPVYIEGNCAWAAAKKILVLPVTPY